MRTDRHNQLTIRTPEGIVFSLRLAGPTQRLLAWLIDVLVVIAICALITIALGILGGLMGIAAGFMGDAALALISMGLFFVRFGYGIFTEWLWHGQTVGKKVMRLRVIDETGLQLTFSQIVIRNLLRFADALPLLYFLGGAVMMLSRYHQRLGDLAANTIVIHEARDPLPSLQQVLSDKYNSFRDFPHLATRLRQVVGAAEGRLALQALLRREQLDPGARAALFKEFADHFRSLVQFPEECTLGLSDEKYVQNVVDVVFRSSTGEAFRPVNQEQLSTPVQS